MRLREVASGIDFDAVDRKPVHIFFLLLAPEELAGLHIQMLSRISRILRDPSFRKRLIEEGDDKDIYSEYRRRGQEIRWMKGITVQEIANDKSTAWSSRSSRASRAFRRKSIIRESKSSVS